MNWYWTVWMVWMSVKDVRTFRVPGWLILGGGVLGIVFNLMFTMTKMTDVSPEGWAIVRILLGTLPGVFLLLITYITKAVGYGDGLVLIVLGMVVGLQKAVLLLAIALFLAALCSVLLLVLRRVRKNSRLPFLPFLTVGWLLVGTVGGV